MSSTPSGALPVSRAWPWIAGLMVAIPAAWMIASLQAVLVVAAVAAGALVLLVLRWPVSAGIAVVASVPAQQVGAVGPLTVTRALVVLAVVVTILVMLARRSDIVVAWILIPFSAVIAWMCISATRAADAALATDEVLRWLIALTAFAVLLQVFVGASRRTLVVAVSVIGVVAAMQASLGILQGLLALGPASFSVDGQFSRAYGTFGRPNTFAGYLELTLFPTAWLGLYFARETWTSLKAYRSARLPRLRWDHPKGMELLQNVLFAGLLLGSAATIALGILVSFSRGAWLGVTFGVVVSAGLAFRRAWLVAVIAAPLILLFGIASATVLAPDALTERVESIVADARPFDAASITITDENFAAVERMAHWQAGWDMFRDNSVVGVGPGNFNVMYSEYFVRTQFRESQGHAHNYYIHALAETGVVGFVLYLALMLSALGLAARVAVRASGFPLALALGAFGTTSAAMAHNVFENLHVLNLGIQLAATWALAITAQRMLTKAHQETLPDVEPQPA